MNEPTPEELQRMIQALMEDVATLLRKHDELVYEEKPVLEAEYYQKIGLLEEEVNRRDTELRRIRRKITLIQVCINRKVPWNLDEIEESLNREYSEYQTDLEERIRQVWRQVEEGDPQYLSPEEYGALRKKYFKIARQLHPDLNPNTTPEERKLLQKATLAFAEGDYETIRGIELILEKMPKLDGTVSSTREAMVEQRDQLMKSRSRLMKKIEKIEQEFPFNYRLFLRDPEKVEERVTKLKILLEEYRKGYEVCENRLASMINQEME